MCRCPRYNPLKLSPIIICDTTRSNPLLFDQFSAALTEAIILRIISLEDLSFSKKRPIKP